MALRDIIKKLFGGYGGDSFSLRFLQPNMLSPRDYLNKYTGYVYACISAIAESVARTEFFVVKEDEVKGTQRIEKHEVNRLLNNPNPDLSGFQLREITQTHLELTGESFWYLAMGELSKKPREIYLLRPDLMYVSFDKNTSLVNGYVLKKTDGTEVPFEKNEIIHFKMPNPANPYRGLGTVEAGLLYIQTEEYASTWSRNYIYNNATPAGVVSLPGTVEKDEFEKIKRQWKEDYGTLDKAGKLVFVRGKEVQFTKLGSNLSDVALGELKRMTRDDIMTIFRVSKPILGIVDDVNLANGKNAKRIFLENVIEPKDMRIADTLNAQLMPRYGLNMNGEPTFTIEYENPVPEDELETVTQLVQEVDVYRTVNEAREVRGLDPLDGGDVLRRPINLIDVAESTPSGDAAKAAQPQRKKKVIIPL